VAIKIASWSLSLADKSLIISKELINSALNKWKNEELYSYTFFGLEGCIGEKWNKIPTFLTTLTAKYEKPTIEYFSIR
jgi:hypothetical protein